MAESGIYEIINLVNGKRYVGSALKFKARWHKHRCELRKQRHHSKHLQNAWNKYGPDAFVFRVLEQCGRGDLLEREQHHIDLGCDYNKCLTAGSPLGVKHSVEARRKMSERRRGVPRNRAHVAKCVASLKRRYREDPEFRVACSERVRDSYTDDLRRTRADQSKARWNDPEYREMMREKIRRSHDTERRALTAEQAKERWADPVYRARMLGLMRGREVTEEQRERLRLANLGKKHSLETRRKRSALTDEQASQVLHLRLNGKQYKEISQLTGVSLLSVQRICRRERYQWVDPHIPALTETKHRRKELQNEPSLFSSGGSCT